MSRSSASDDEKQAPVAPVMPLASLLGQYDSDDSSDDDVKETSPADALSTNDGAAKENGGDAVKASSNGEGRSSTLLPSADDLFDTGMADEPPDFLKMPEGPEFDASKHFKPPPVSHADLVPAVEGGRRRRPPGPMLDDEAPEQRYDPEHNFGRGEGAVRLRGSVCHETDDERGRRVVYGAHAVAKADPWSNCNPNFAFHSHASGKKRKNGDT